MGQLLNRLKIGLNDGKVSVFAAATAFPVIPQFLNDLEADPQGTLYVSDSGDIMGTGKGGAIRPGSTISVKRFGA